MPGGVSFPVCGLFAPWAGSRFVFEPRQGAYGLGCGLGKRLTSITIGSWGPAICGARPYPEVIAALHSGPRQGHQLCRPLRPGRNRLARN